MEKQEKNLIKDLFRRIPKQNQPKVLEALKIRTNRQRIEYLRGWLSLH